MKLVGNKEEGYRVVSSFAVPAKPPKTSGKGKGKDNNPEPPAPDDKNGATAPDNEKENEKGKDNK